MRIVESSIYHGTQLHGIFQSVSGSTSRSTMRRPDPSAGRLLVITHPLIEVKSSVKSGTWRRVGSKPVQWVFGVRSVTFQKKRSKLLREWPHDWHCADNYFHRCSASTLV